jgi:WD40 repeat protein
VAARFSSDGTRIVTASFDQTARIWDAQSGKPIGQPLHHGNKVVAASFSPDGTRIVTASYDHTARIWDAQSGKAIGPPLHHDDEVAAASFSPDGTRILTSSKDHTARIWDVGVDLEAPLPEWLPVLLEALGGKQLNEHGSLIDNQYGLFEIREQLLALQGDNFWSRLGRWFVTLGPERTIGPNSTVTVLEWNQNQAR